MKRLSLSMNFEWYYTNIINKNTFIIFVSPFTNGFYFFITNLKRGAKFCDRRDILRIKLVLQKQRELASHY